jgi:chromosome segregation protein
MLTALELSGFKSFADKTRFDFSDGITVVVGPNGSGKSNIVDAIKWVLGTQSAKSLRGDDMADVIFKGSAAGGRKACNSAEATLVLENRDRSLPVDADEIHVTRRVFRSGESEYLINREPRRLKDIRDLFRGTGVGIDAYSLIEQGKIDRMLQASAKDRRAIFEEAAGISRFKSKKAETDRRLQRVDQSLVRLHDIVDEVNKRLTTLKSQASKAQQFRQMTTRLAELRTQLGCDELRQIQNKLDDLQKSLADNEAKRLSLAEQSASAIKRVEATEGELQSHVVAMEAAQQEQQTRRERVAALESSEAALRERILDLEHERELNVARQVALSEKAGLTADEVLQRQAELDEWEIEWTRESSQLQRIDEQRLDLEQRLSSCHDGLTRLREEAVQSEKKVAIYRSQVETLRSRASQSSERLTTLQTLHAEWSSHVVFLEAAVREKQLERDRLESIVTEVEQAREPARLEVERLRLESARAHESAIHHQGRLQGVRERLLLLEQLEDRQEGIGRGAKKLIELAHTEPRAPWNTVKGLVADLIEIDVHLAPLVDVALGPAAETVVLSDGCIIDLIREGSLNLEGRVSLLRIDRLPSRRSGEKIQLDGLRGVIGRADRLVHYHADYAPLFHYLLGSTWLVDSLSTALDLSHLRGAGLRFVTAACERIDPDGTLSIGALQTALGLVSRRSEMLAARDEIRHLEEWIARDSTTIADLQTKLDSAVAQEKELQLRLEDSRRDYSEAAIHVAADVRSLEQRLREVEDNERERESVLEVITGIDQEINSLEQHLNDERVKSKKTVADLVEEEQRLKQIESELSQTRDEWTAAKVVLARHEQRLEGLRAGLEQLNRDSKERQAAVEDVRRAFDSLEAKILQAQTGVAEAVKHRDDLRLSIEVGASELAVLLQKNQELQDSRRDATKQSDQLQRQLDRTSELHRSLENELQQQRARAAELKTRYREDYQIDLSDREQLTTVATVEDRSNVESEVSRLRQDIATVGAVNMEALRELDELQSRYDTLYGHYQDLSDAKQNLQKIIEKIDLDSQRLFAETLEAIRVNFQDLYRRSFGGGHADLVLEQCVDMSEAGVEIMATPPGKTAFSNSLLSGGEKALTAVALIMAIFKYRPSPFCILDEVDAPFDEANIGRFVSVLKEFLHMTKFVVVSHSKKTMTAANTIYGVTMQENGVSRQVAVRFEDVDDEFLDDNRHKKAA